MPEISFTGLRDVSQQDCVDLLVLFAKAGFGLVGAHLAKPSRIEWTFDMIVGNCRMLNVLWGMRYADVYCYLHTSPV